MLSGGLATPTTPLVGLIQLFLLMSTGWYLEPDRKTPNRTLVDVRYPVPKNANPRPGEAPAEDPGQIVGVAAAPRSERDGTEPEWLSHQGVRAPLT